MKILYISIGSFWKNAAMKTYQHHDALFNALRKYVPDLEIHIGVPMQGSTYLKNLIENNNDNRVIETWKNLPYKVYADLYQGDFDAMVINGSEDFWDIEAPYRVIPAAEVNQYIYDKAVSCIESHKPVILFDPDNYINENIGGNLDRNLARRLHYVLHNYEGYQLTGPFMNGVENFDRYQFTPFTINPNDNVSKTIKPLTERSYVTKYVGNNYMRDHFVSYFRACAMHGKVQVVGSGWGRVEKDDILNTIEWKSKFPLTTDKVVDYYSDAKLALYGTTSLPSFRKGGHCTLRIREFYQAGILVMPEQYHPVRNFIDPGECNTSTVMCHGAMQEFVNSTASDNEGYESLVKIQRALILEYFNADRYAEMWSDWLLK